MDAGPNGFVATERCRVAPATRGIKDSYPCVSLSSTIWRIASSFFENGTVITTILKQIKRGLLLLCYEIILGSISIFLTMTSKMSLQECTVGMGLIKGMDTTYASSLFLSSPWTNDREL